MMNDERTIMLGLDPTEAVKSVLITCMRMCCEADFKIEIRVGLGGTEESLTARTPAYAIAPIALLYQLLELSKYLLNRKSSVPTTMSHTPLLIFYSAYTASMKANEIEKNVAEQNANAMLMYIQGYINQYHSDLVQYVRYAKDHSNTYDTELLKRITVLLNESDQDKLRDALNNHAIRHNSTEKDSIEYASTHAIGFRDIIDKKNPQPLFHPLNQNEINIQFDQEIHLPDCIVSVGGSVECHFNQARHIIQQAFRNSLQDHDKERFHLPLSIRMLSKAGHTPVYYHCKGEVIFADVLKSNTDILYENKNMAGDVKTDLSIITDDIGLSLLKPMLKCIIAKNPSKIIPLENPILTLTELCRDYLEEYTEVENEISKSSDETTKAVIQFFSHYDILDYSNDDTSSIIDCIIDCLKKQKETEIKKELKKQNKKQNAIAHGKKDSRLRSDSATSNESTTDSPRSRGNTVLSTESSTDSLRSRSNTELSINSATDGSRLRTDSTLSKDLATNYVCSRNGIRPVGRDTINKINEKCNYILGRIFIAFMKKFGDKQQSKGNE